jgi:hypothetical protein
MASLNIRVLRQVALAGLAAVLLVDFYLSVRLGVGLGLGAVVLLVFPIAAVLVSLVLMPGAAGTLLRNKDLLVLLALVTVVGRFLEWLAAAPVLGALLSPSFPLHFLNLSFALSLHFLLRIALAMAYATWMTAAVLELVRTGNGDPCPVLPAALNRFWWVLGLEFIGWAVVMLATAAVLLLMPVMGFFALVPMLIFGVAWNFATAAVLPLAWRGEAGFWHSFRTGVSASLANLARWWLLLLVQMLLLGLVFFYYSSGGGHTNVSWSVNVFWTGGYEADCRWYGKLAEACHTSKLPFVETLLSLLFGAFAVAIKIAIVQRLQPEAPPVIPSAASAGMSTEGRSHRHELHGHIQTARPGAASGGIVCAGRPA